MMNKKIYIILLLLLLIPCIFAIEESVVTTDIKVNYDNSTRILKIQGENLDWSKTLNSSFSTTLQIILVRKFGNVSEVTELLEVCRDNLNFSQKWKACVELNKNISVQLFDMVNQTDYDSCMANLTSTKHQYELNLQQKENEKNNAISKAEEERDKAKGTKNWVMIIGGVGWVIAAFLFNKYRGFGRRETFNDRDKSLETSF